MNLFKTPLAHRPTPIMVSKNFADPNQECWKQQYLKVVEIQKITKGKGAVLCFIDDGIGLNTELLHIVEKDGKFVAEGNKIINPIYSFLDSEDFMGDHSTNGATIVAGNTLGIFPEMKFISMPVLDPVSGVGAMHNIVSAIGKAIELDLGVINLSLGANAGHGPTEKALKKFCSNGKRIATIAAGNDGPGNTDFPAWLAKRIKGCLSIAATQIDEQGNVSIAMFSSQGTISLSAPGHALKTMNQDNRIDYVSGTSFAAPIVGSTIAVAQMLNPNLTQDQVIHYFKTTSNRMDKEPTTKQGYGNIDIVGFLNKAIADEKAPNIDVKKHSFLDKIKEIIG